MDKRVRCNPEVVVGHDLTASCEIRLDRAETFGKPRG